MFTLYFNKYPYSPDSSGNPACWELNCKYQYGMPGPCARVAPPWSRAYTCSNDLSGASQTALTEQANRLQMRRKAEVLQYKKNSANLTKKQKWSQLARGKSHNKKQVWATQSDTYTNPNTQGLYEEPDTFILKCKNAINCPPTCPPPTQYSSSASDVPGRPIPLFLDRRVPAWGVGPQYRTSATGIVEDGRGHGVRITPGGGKKPITNPILRLCVCADNDGGYWGSYTGCEFWHNDGLHGVGTPLGLQYGPFSCLACDPITGIPYPGGSGTAATFYSHHGETVTGCPNPDNKTGWTPQCSIPDSPVNSCT